MPIILSIKSSSCNILKTLPPIISPPHSQTQTSHIFDFAETKIIANRAYKMFIKGDLTALSDSDSTDTEIIQEV